VLDEADHMFDMGFLPDLRRILAALPERRQNLLFSATMPGAIRQLASAVLSKPYVVELANRAPAATIDHALYAVTEERKRDLLERILAATTAPPRSCSRARNTARGGSPISSASAATARWRSRATCRRRSATAR
jgi:ATP-dependent RNA helicase RhlE